jgi:uncharacterized membrane protein YbaN (DUF454 family)
MSNIEIIIGNTVFALGCAGVILPLFIVNRKGKR